MDTTRRDLLRGVAALPAASQTAATESGGGPAIESSTTGTAARPDSLAGYSYS